MAEDCDPAVLHARVSVLEANDIRHETDINQLFNKVSALEVCASSLPGIEKGLERLNDKVDTLTACSQRSNGEKIAYLTMREWLILAVGILAFLLDHFVIV